MRASRLDLAAEVDRNVPDLTESSEPMLTVTSARTGPEVVTTLRSVPRVVSTVS